MRTSIVVVLGAWIVAAAPHAGTALAQGAAAPTAPAANSAAANQNPSDIVQEAAQNILKALDANRDMYRKDPTKMRELVDKYLLPHFDTEYAAKLVLAQNWRNATPEQRKRFVEAFYRSLLMNYGSALADFTSDRMKVLPTKVEPGADHTTVRTEIKRDSGDRIAVNYVLHMTPEGWKAYDVNIDGISYVKSYRDDFGAQIQQQGLDAVISRLERGEKPSEINKTTGSKS
jgi:phospholipid transport system substrate-binding protein